MRPRPRRVIARSMPQVAEQQAQNGCWFVPSRNRPERARECVEACSDAGQATPGVLIQDGCHYSFGRSVRSVGRDLYPAMPKHWSAIQTPEHRELAGALTYGWKLFPDYDWYGIISDGVRPKTPGWDRLLLAAAEGRNFVSCSDGWRDDQRMSGVLLVPGWIVAAVGYWFPPGMVHLWTDDCWEHLGAVLDNWVYAEDVHVEDNHFAHSDPAHQVPRDHLRTFRGKEYSSADREIFNDWRYGPQFFEAVERVKAAWKLATGRDWQQVAA